MLQLLPAQKGQKKTRKKQGDGGTLDRGAAPRGEREGEICCQFKKSRIPQKLSSVCTQTLSNSSSVASGNFSWRLSFSTFEMKRIPYLTVRRDGSKRPKLTTPKAKNAATSAENVRDLIHRHDDGRQEFVSDGLHVLDGGLQPGPHLLVAHGLLWSHVIRQLTGDREMGGERERETGKGGGVVSYTFHVEPAAATSRRRTSAPAHLASPVWVSIWLTQLL